MLVRPLSLAASVAGLACALTLSACGSKDESAKGPAAGGEATATPPAQGDAPQPVPVSFDLETVPVSTAELGAFPYVAPTAGYGVVSDKTMDLAAFPIWTGQAFQVVEGKVYMASSRTPDGKEYSRIEFERGFENAVKALGGVRVATGVAPNPVIDALPNSLRSDMNAGLTIVYGNPITSYVIRRADRAIWIQIISDSSQSVWAVVDAPIG